MKAFTISVDIYATRFGNPYHVKAATTIDVDDDTKLDEIMDIPIGQLILGSAYKPEKIDPALLEALIPKEVSATDIDKLTEMIKVSLLKAYPNDAMFTAVRHGRWIDKGDYAVCTECGGHSGTQRDGVEPIALMSRFCPNCGALMDNF